MKSLAVALVLTLSAPITGQGIIHVDAGAPPGGTGSAASPFFSIQAGIVAAGPSDQVLVGVGRYVETIDFLGKSIVVRSSGGPLRTIIDGNQLGSVVRFVTNESPAAILSGFTITNGQGATGAIGAIGDAGGIHCVGSSPLIEHCIIKANRGGNGGPGAFTWNPCCQFALGCIPCQVQTRGGDGGPGGVLCWDGNPSLVNCTIVGNTGGGAVGGQMFSIEGTGGVHGARSASAFVTFNVSILHCTIVGNTAGNNSGGSFTQIGGVGSGLWPAVFPPYVTMRVVNSIVWGNGGTQINAPQSTAAVVSFSNVMGGFPGSGNLSVDPLFVDAAQGNWHLGPTSPCLDAGTTSPVFPNSLSLPATDFEGHPRNVHSGPDLGADEITLAVELSQVGGPGSPVLLVDHYLIPGREYFNCFTFDEPCPLGVGGGPWGGLCAVDPSFLLFQISLPVGAAPVHFLAPGATTSFGPFPVPPVVLEVVLFDFTGGTFGLVSPVRRFAVQ